MLRRVELGLKAHVTDTVGHKVARGIVQALGVPVNDCQIVRVFTVQGVDDSGISRLLDAAVLHDPVLHDASTEPISTDFDWTIEVGFRPGVTDNQGRTARESVALVLGLSKEDAQDVAVYTSTRYLLHGDLSEDDVINIGRNFLANELIQRFEYKSAAQWAKEPGFTPRAAQVTGEAVDEVNIIDLSVMSDQELTDFSRANTLALSLEEMQTIRDHFLNPDVIADRKAAGLAVNPTDAELEALAQTWSEHCKHKIFSAEIDYEDRENGTRTTIDSIFKTYIMDSTAQIREQLGDKDFCLSVFKDNAGVITFDENHSICIKVETHNSPSALDPYGGALTGIVGVNRDPMGTGMGANLVCNTDVFCFASPFYNEEMPPRLLHPRRVLEGVREGVEHGGNKSGIPTVNGSLVFHENYLGKPLVFCGTIGLLPNEVAGKPSHEKDALPGDAIVMCGGRIGKDGIHGATFSSEELHEGSPATAVQIGDPITQRKMYDFLMRARDLGMYNAITDNGAGGLSSSVGEMAEMSGGCRMDLSKAPLKYDGLRPWEILLSEAQERMTLAVPQDKLPKFLELAEEMAVETNVLGEFTDSGYFHVTYGDKPVAYVSMDFLHDGVPQMKLKAIWERPEQEPYMPLFVANQGELLKKMLGRLNICSKEYIVRQYDHEVQGGSAVKPLTGAENDGPSDAGALRPVLGTDKGIVVSHGICPKFSELDTYWMMASAIDEAIRNAVATGANPEHMAGTDNFCWCDPVQSEKTPDGHYKLAQLVRANQALAHYCQSFGVPCISGKDSMKNDYTGGGKKISIPPTVLFSVLGLVDDVNKCVTSDLKAEGDLIYILGLTRPELGGSEISDMMKSPFSEVPQVDAVSARERYRTLYAVMQDQLVAAAHDLSDGGLAVAAAEMCIGGRMGAEINLENVPVCPEGMAVTDTLYSESNSRLLVSVKPENKDAFEAAFAGQHFALIGKATASSELVIKNGETQILAESVDSLAHAWQSTFGTDGTGNK
ncbi:AIR synthase-related protein [Desulfobaculum bizertense]|uniref:Phosphoribosylformylglycinamidine synthase subunit PurL n=1 Tax=Desulfobaculum bizertense DSM 18034 TaxID=1121442 RepID=A0A1T4WSZ0_9BACT|nr:AIR synthase-related protein [Desulfobaculum bizertense]SKA80237.1 phosphoribosylformylglycinamidine synthase subunit II [Desulfobaculum bizertense DSM 18034]